MFPRRTDSARLLRTLHCSCVGILYSCCASVAGHSAGDGAKITSGGCSWAEDASVVQYLLRLGAARFRVGLAVLGDESLIVLSLRCRPRAAKWEWG